MPRYLCITVRFLQPYFHGRDEKGQPEWPPSPLRLFQALVAASAARWNERTAIRHAAPALRWLECQGPPVIHAPAAVTADSSYRLYVPDNVADLVADSQQRGGSKTIADFRTEKDVRPSRLDGDAVCYLFPLADDTAEFQRHQATLIDATRSITHLGWGTDVVVADATEVSMEHASELPGQRWIPLTGSVGKVQLRSPVTGTLENLAERHTSFLTRMQGNCLVPVPPLSLFDVVSYSPADEPVATPFAVFSILTPTGSGYRAFDAARRTTVVAGMVRHALANLAQQQRPFGWSDDDITTIVQGHAPAGGPARVAADAPRFAYLPLPSIERRGLRGKHVGMIRRVMVTGRPGMREQVSWVRRALSGSELIDEHSGKVQGVLSLTPPSDWVARQYCGQSSIWTTVTPVVLPGYDDRSGKKTDRLLRKALQQAGYPRELTRHAELETRGVGFLPGAELSSQYRRPQNIREAPVRHVRIHWRNRQGESITLPGPIAVGSGRFRGLGLFATMAQ